jgi:hypothetical protein
VALVGFLLVRTRREPERLRPVVLGKASAYRG